MLNNIRAFRKELHRNPELSGKEIETAERIREFIENTYPGKFIDNIGGNGLAVIYEFSEGPVVMIRCELDALPIEEANKFEHRSLQTGVSHKCGHDGHMAIVAGLCHYIKQRSFKKGKIVLLFQPAEETGKGAQLVINDPRFEELKPDYIFALHNLPGEPLNSVIMVKDYFSATVQSFSVSLRGKVAHASEPEQGINPAGAIAQLISGFSILKEEVPEKEEFALLTPVYINLGTQDYGISAGTGEMHYTIRTWNENRMEQLKDKILNLVGDICKKENLTFSLDWFDHFPATINDAQCNNYIEKTAKSLGLETIMRPYPLKFGEDFGWYSRDFKTAMFGLGAGKDCPALHHADYDFHDKLLETGINMFLGILDQVLRSGE